MHIGFYTECLNRPFTGIEKVTDSLIEELGKRGHKLTLFHSKNPSHPSYKQNSHHYFKKSLPLPFATSFSALFRSSCFEKVDLLHLTTAQFFYGRRPRVPIILTVHDTTPLLFPQFHLKRTRLYFKFFFQKYLCEADALITISESTKRDLLRFYTLPEKKIVVIPPVFPFSKEVKRLPKEKMILYLGTLEPRKNVIGLIKAFGLLKKKGYPHKLVLAGKKGWAYASIFKLIETLGLQKQITHMGYVSEEQKSDLFRRAEVFAYPSFYEGFGIPLLEAMQYGTAVVTSHGSSLSEVVGEGGILVDPKNSLSIANGICKAILHNATWSEKAILRAKVFSSEKVLRDTESLYRQLL